MRIGGARLTNISRWSGWLVWRWGESGLVALRSANWPSEKVKDEPFLKVTPRPPSRALTSAPESGAAAPETTKNYLYSSDLQHWESTPLPPQFDNPVRSEQTPRSMMLPSLLVFSIYSPHSGCGLFSVTRQTAAEGDKMRRILKQSTSFPAGR